MNPGQTAYLATADRNAFKALMHYADQLDALPLELTRTMSDLRELDAVLGGHVSNLNSRMSQLTALVENRHSTPGERLVTLKEVAEEARGYKLGGDDKIRVAVAAAETLAAAERKLDEAFSRINAHPTIAPFTDPVSYLRHLNLIPGSVPDLDSLTRLPGVAAPPPSGSAAAALETLAIVAQRTGLPAPSASHTTVVAPVPPGAFSVPDPPSGTPKRRGGKTTTASVQNVPSRSNTPQIEAARRGGANGSRASPSAGPGGAGKNKRKAPGGDEAASKKKRNKAAPQDAPDPSDDSRAKAEKATPSPHPGSAAATLVRRQERSGTPAGARSPALGGRRPAAQGRGSSMTPAPYTFGAGGKGPPPEAVALTAQAGKDEARYCFCNQVSFGEMIACDAPNCPREWFHLSCVGLTTTPDGSWFCADCQARGAMGTSKKKKPQTRRR